MSILLSALILVVSDPRTPTVSPDGLDIVFGLRGDLWAASTDGGLARCLTPGPSRESLPCYSPDGSLLAFTSGRTGGGDVYVMDSAGGEASRLTWHGGFDAVAGWTADGDSILFISSREGGEGWLYSVPVSGGTPRPRIRAVVDSFAPVPGGMAVERGFTPWWRRHYSGSGSRDVWLASDDGSWTRLLSTGLDERSPMWSDPAGGLLFLREDSAGNANLHLLGADGDVIQLTRSETDITFPSISADGSTVVFELDGGLSCARHPGWTPVPIELDDSSDLPVPLDVEGYAGPFVEEWDLLSDTGIIAIASGGEIFCGRLEDGGIEETRRLTDTPGREGAPAWSPDGRTLAFTREWDGRSELVIAGPVISDSAFTGHGDIPSRVLPTAGSTALDPAWSPSGDMIAYLDSEASLRVVEPATGRDWAVCSETGIIHIAWSPDGRWLAFSVPLMGHLEDVFAVPSGGGEPLNMSRHPNDDFQPFWSSDGRRLIYASRTDEGSYSIRQVWLTRADYEEDEEGREALLEQPVPAVVIETDGIQRRTETLCTITGYYDFYGASPDGRWFAFRAYDQEGTSDLWVVDWTGSGLDRLSFSGCAPEEIGISPEETIYFIGLGGVLQSIPAAGGTEKVLSWRERTSWSIPLMQAQKFDECWRLLRDSFYDSGMHGVDWDGMRERYRGRASACLDNADFNDVVSRMLGELSASHLGIYGPWEWDSSMPTGETGVIPDFAWDGEGIRVDSVIPWSPSDIDPSRLLPGDVILSIDGMPVGAGENLYRPLAGTVSEEVVLEVRRGGAIIEMIIEPVSPWRMNDLAYEAWIDRNRRMVDDLSDGRVGYLHIAAMNGEGVDTFLEDLFAEGLGREGMIIDVRGNGGGSTHDEIIRRLARPGYLLSRSRDGGETLQPLGVWQEPMALLINERCFSDAEIFPAGWKELGLGPVVGTATFGGVIGTNDIELIDGTGFRIPSEGWFTLAGENLENSGVQPDIPVAELPGDYALGVDRQLEAAVEAVLSRI